MPQAVTEARKSIESSESSVWLAYDRTGFTVLRNPSKSPRGLHGSPKRPYGNASASTKNSDVSTDASGTIVETLDYYPYGGTRIDSGSYSSDRKYIGQQYSAAAQIYYLNARYYDPNRGQFLSEDPIFTSSPGGQNLGNPQSLNAYSYALDNPITLKDPSGKATIQQHIQQLRDGDFTYLIETILKKGSIVKIVSNASKWTDLAGHVHSRFAKRLRDVINANRGAVTLIDLASIKALIKKEIPPTV